MHASVVAHMFTFNLTKNDWSDNLETYITYFMSIELFFIITYINIYI
jgi:hypothetical protein